MHAWTRATTRPTGGSASWTAFEVRTTTPADCGKEGPGIDCQAALTSVSCGSASRCVAVDGLGDVVTATDPARGATSWRVTKDPQTDPPDLMSLSCPTSSLCLAVDVAGTIYSTNDPGRDLSRWKRTNRPHTNGYGAVQPPSVSCGSPDLCVETLGDSLATSIRPTQGPETWITRDVDRRTAYGFEAVSCVRSKRCVAVDGNGRATVGAPAPRHR